jgi:hypothetical protein
MAFNYLFFDTPGRPTAFVSTPDQPVFVETSGLPTAFFGTPFLPAFVDTTGRPTAFVSTPDQPAFMQTAGRPTAFVTTFGTDVDKILVLKFGTVTIESDCSSVTFTDGTGTAPADPTGYFAESGTGNNPLEQPKRSEVDLWYVWSYYDGSGVEILQFPDVQNGSASSFQVPTTDDDGVVVSGIYKLYLVAVPTGTDYNEYKGDPVVVSGEIDGWFVSEAGVLVDCAVNECVNRARWERVKALMTGGNCTEEYPLYYTIINGITQSLRILDYASALKGYKRLVALCNGGEDCGCGC